MLMGGNSEFFFFYCTTNEHEYHFSFSCNAFKANSVHTQPRIWIFICYLCNKFLKANQIILSLLQKKKCTELLAHVQLNFQQSTEEGRSNSEYQNHEDLNIQRKKKHKVVLQGNSKTTLWRPLSPNLLDYLQCTGILLA